MTRERMRCWIALFLLTLLAVVALRGGEAKDVAVTLGPLGMLAARVIVFYFPRPEKKR